MMVYNLADKNHGRLSAGAELLMYSGGGGDDDEGEECDAIDDDADSNAENYYLNEYPDEDEFDRDDDEHENDTTSDESFCLVNEFAKLNF